MAEIREKVAQMIGSYVVHGDNGGPDTEVLHDVIGGDYDEATRRVYELTDAILNLIGGDGWKPHWRHAKRGSEYQQIGTGLVQSDVPLNDMAMVVIYRGDDGQLWARRYEEFFDGRFELIAASPPPKDTP